MEKRTYPQNYPVKRWSTQLKVSVNMRDYEKVDAVLEALEAAATEIEAAGVPRSEASFVVSNDMEYGDAYMSFTIEGERTATPAERKAAQAQADEYKKTRTRQLEEELARLKADAARVEDALRD
jgi:hypothetical protein